MGEPLHVQYNRQLVASCVTTFCNFHFFQNNFQTTRTLNANISKHDGVREHVYKVIMILLKKNLQMHSTTIFFSSS